MKKWSEYTRREKAMILAILILSVVVLLNWGRVRTGVGKGMQVFYGAPVDSVPQP